MYCNIYYTLNIIIIILYNYYYYYCNILYTDLKGIMFMTESNHGKKKKTWRPLFIKYKLTCKIYNSPQTPHCRSSVC